jgi:hypothetical protein
MAGLTLPKDGVGREHWTEQGHGRRESRILLHIRLRNDVPALTQSADQMASWIIWQLVPHQGTLTL